MALSKVGAAPNAASRNIPVGGTLDIVFTPDTTWVAGDVLVGLVAWGAVDNNQLFTAQLSDSALTWEADTQFILDATAPNGVGWQFSFHPAWAPFYHTVTSGEAGAGAITLTATLASVSSVDGSAGVDPGFILCAGGVAVRGGNMPTTGVHLWVPYDSSDTDNAVQMFGASPQTATFNGPLDGYSDGEVGQLLLHVYGLNMGAKDKTGGSAVWTGPTELTDYFLQNGIETGATDVDLNYGMAYELLGATDDWPASETCQWTWAGGGNSSAWAIRMGFGFLSSAPVEPTNPGEPFHFDYRRRRFVASELPYDVSAPRMFP